MKKFLSVLLAVCLLAGCLPLSASASASGIVSVAQKEVGVSGRPNTYTRWYGSIPGYPDSGYSYPWCAAFVSWCAYKAGESAAVPKNSGVSSLRRNVLNAGGKTVSASEVRAGDLVFYQLASNGNYLHVGIMSSATTSIEGNLGNAVKNSKPSAYRTDSSTTVANGKVKVSYVRPNYTGNPAPLPTNVKVSTNKATYTVGETVTMTPSATGATGFALSVRDANDESNILYSHFDLFTGSLTYTPTKTGKQIVWVTAYNSTGQDSSSYCYITINSPPPSNVKVTTNKSVYTVGETVTMTPSATEAKNFALSVRDAHNESDIIYPHFERFTGPLQFTPTKPGEYIVWVTAYNSTEQTSSSYCYFTVNAPLPSNVKVTPNKTTYNLGETVTMMPSATGAVGFALSVREADNESNILYSHFDLFTGSLSYTPTKAGKYIIWVTAYNSTNQTTSAFVYFTVESPNQSESSSETTPIPEPEEMPYDPTPENSFIDVPNGAYFAEAVNWAVDKGITAGTSRNTFSPNAICTRAQAVTFLWRAAGSPEPSGGSTKFVDVAGGQYYTKAVQWAVEKGITGGTSATTFSPNDKCTRAQIVTFQYRMHNSPSVSGVSPFADVPPTLYYANAVAWAVENGITSGTSASTFSPHNDCSRGQIVTFLYRDMN